MNRILRSLRAILALTVFAPFTTFLMVVVFLSGVKEDEDFMYVMIYVSVVWFILLLTFLEGAL